jgi:hypothetical protein
VSWMLLHDRPQSMPRMYLYYIMTAGGDTQGGADASGNTSGTGGDG